MIFIIPVKVALDISGIPVEIQWGMNGSVAPGVHMLHSGPMSIKLHYDTEKGHTV